MKIWIYKLSKEQLLGRLEEAGVDTTDMFKDLCRRFGRLVDQQPDMASEKAEEAGPPPPDDLAGPDPAKVLNQI